MHATKNDFQKTELNRYMRL